MGMWSRDAGTCLTPKNKAMWVPVLWVVTARAPPFAMACQSMGLAVVVLGWGDRRGLVAGKKTPRKDLLTTISKLRKWAVVDEPGGGGSPVSIRNCCDGLLSRPPVWWG
jgi:hypothetical protein